MSNSRALRGEDRCLTMMAHPEDSEIDPCTKEINRGGGKGRRPNNPHGRYFAKPHNPNLKKSNGKFRPS